LPLLTAITIPGQAVIDSGDSKWKGSLGLEFMLRLFCFRVKCLLLHFTQTIHLRNNLKDSGMEDIRGFPSKFFELPSVTQNDILSIGAGDVVHPIYQRSGDTDGSIFKHLIPIVSNSTNVAERNLLHRMIMISLSESEFDELRVLRLMRFFRVQGFIYFPIHHPASIIKLIKLFPFGCFGKNPIPRTQLQNATQFLNRWFCGVDVMGMFRLAWSLVIIPDMADFQYVVANCSVETVTVKEVLDSFPGYNKTLSNLLHAASPITARSGKKLQDYHDRVKLIIEKLSSRALLYGHGESSYLFLGKTGSEIGCARHIKRPVWTKETHHQMDRTFQRLALQILLMCKFKWRKFPLCKDLIPMFLAHFFQSHLDWLAS
jgi:hypothetical protein